MTTGSILKEILSEVKPRLERIPESESTSKPNPNKWSKKEILGHLIDSASNNHQRFVRAGLQDNLVFQGYQQEESVQLQDFQHADWKNLIELWYEFNLFLATVIDGLPDEIKNKRHQYHNLDEIAWKTVPKTDFATLDYFMKDYVGHLEHHVRQILPDYEPRMIGNY
jgi:hypothetical protein